MNLASLQVLADESVAKRFAARSSMNAKKAYRPHDCTAFYGIMSCLVICIKEWSNHR
jgi:hypothetical protein